MSSTMDCEHEDPWITCKAPLYTLQVLPSVGTVRLTVGASGWSRIEMDLEGDRVIVVRFAGGVKGRDQAEKQEWRITLDCGVCEIEGERASEEQADRARKDRVMEEEAGGVVLAQRQFRMVEGPLREWGGGWGLGLGQGMGGDGGREGGGKDGEGGGEGISGLESVHCGTCGVKLTKPDTPFQRILPLPSPYWHELADMWICHDDFRCRSPMANLSPGDVRPREGDCLHAAHHLLLHASTLAPNAIKWTGEAVGMWGGVACTRCDGSLGQAMLPPAPREPRREGGKEEGKTDVGRKKEEGGGGGSAPAPAPRKKSVKSSTRSKLRSKRAVVTESNGSSLFDIDDAHAASLPALPGLKGEQDRGGLTVVLPDGTCLPWEQVRGADMEPPSPLRPDPPPSPGGSVSCVMPEAPPSSDVKLLKQWAASCTEVGGPRDLFRHHTFLRRCSYDMLQLAGAHCCYRFVARAADNALAPRILISLLSWKCKLGSNLLHLLHGPDNPRPPPANHGDANVQHAHPIQVAQCMYCEHEEEWEEGGASASGRLLARWQETPNNVECLDYTEEECELLLEGLRMSSAIVPPTMRILSGLPVGFLPV